MFILNGDFKEIIESNYSQLKIVWEEKWLEKKTKNNGGELLEQKDQI